jgi:hypothetical protein
MTAVKEHENRRLVSARVVALVLAMFTCLAAARDSAAAEKLLRWKFEPGQKLRVVCTQESRLETSVNNVPLDMQIDMGLEMLWSVDSVDADGTATITQSFTRLTSKMQTEGAEPIEYDSAAPDEPEGDAARIAKAVKPLLGAKFVVKMNDRGGIVEVALPEELVQALQEAGIAPGGGKGKEVLEGVFRQTLPLLPDAAVGEGKTWDDQREAKVPGGTLVVQSRYTYEGEENREGATVAKIACKSRLEFNRSKEEVEFPLVLKDHEQTGTLYFDVQAGRLVSAETTQKMTTEAGATTPKTRVRSTARVTVTVTPIVTD